MANITRVDPLEDLFRGFFVRPVDLNSSAQQPPSIKMDVKEQGDNYLVGKVSRSFQLGQEIDDAKAAAKFNEGVLELTLPKRAASPNKRLTVE